MPATLSGARSRHAVGQAGTYLVVIAIVLAVLIPLFWMVSASLKTQNEVYDFAWLPRVPQWHNYVVGLTTFQFGRYFINTILVTGINVVAGGIVASWTAFALARLEFPGRNLIFALVLGTMMLPFAAYMIPSFVLFRWLGWIDTYTVLTVPFFLAVPGFFVFLIRQYYMTIPREFDDSAKIDGCNFFKIYWYLLLPLSRPGAHHRRHLHLPGQLGGPDPPGAVHQQQGNAHRERRPGAAQRVHRAGPGAPPDDGRVGDLHHRPDRDLPHVPALLPADGRGRPRHRIDQVNRRRRGG